MGGLLSGIGGGGQGAGGILGALPGLVNIFNSGDQQASASDDSGASQEWIQGFLAGQDAAEGNSDSFESSNDNFNTDGSSGSGTVVNNNILAT